MSDATCKACGRKVVFALDENGTRQVLDPSAPVYGLMGNGRCVRIGVAGVRDTGTPGSPGVRAAPLVSHWSTCRKPEVIKAMQEAAGD